MNDSQISTSDRIIAAAEKRMRTGGFHGFSFREVAADVGIKSASVHHHFPAKEDLAAATAHAYAERFMAALGDPNDEGQNPLALIRRYIALFSKAQLEDRRMCLCGVLASEALDLPEQVTTEAQRFSALNVDWLKTVIRRTEKTAKPRDAEARAKQIVASMEGAMMIANVTGDDCTFNQIAASVADGFK